jgi:hypothetical protein
MGRDKRANSRRTSKTSEEAPLVRPGRNQPGTFDEQLNAVLMFLHVPVRLRRRYRDSVWQHCLEAMLPHVRFIEFDAALRGARRDVQK